MNCASAANLCNLSDLTVGFSLFMAIGSPNPPPNAQVALKFHTTCSHYSPSYAPGAPDGVVAGPRRPQKLQLIVKFSSRRSIDTFRRLRANPRCRGSEDFMDARRLIESSSYGPETLHVIFQV